MTTSTNAGQGATRRAASPRATRANAAVELGIAPLTSADISAIAHGARVTIAPHAAERIRQARALVQKALHGRAAIYGLNTGLGANVDTPLTSEQLVSFQVSVTRSHRAAVGPNLDTLHVRAIMATRLAEIAHGGAGVSPAVAQAIANALNAGFHPVVPALGSVGAADLSPLAQIANALIGEGEAEFHGTVMPAAQALKAAGLVPMPIAEKDGHSFVVANSYSVGSACLSLRQLRAAFEWSLKAVALNYEAFLCNLRILDQDALAARPAFGQVEVGAELRKLMEGSRLWDYSRARRLQDPLSYRCVPQIWGALHHAINEADLITDIELSHPTENPVITEGGRIIPTANFDLTAFAQSWERLDLALSNCASATTYRISKIMSHGLTDLPRFLTLHAGNAGFGQIQRSASALDAEIRHLALPVSFDPIAVSDAIEDEASMAPRVIAKTDEIVERWWILIAIELISSAQAVDLRGAKAALGTGAREAYEFVRTYSVFLDEDRALGPEVTSIAQAMRSRAVSSV